MLTAINFNKDDIADTKDSPMITNSDSTHSLPLKLPLLQDAEEDMSRYTRDYLPYKHTHYVALETAAGPVCVSIRKQSGYILAMVRTSNGTQHYRISRETIKRPRWIFRLVSSKWPTASDVLSALGHPLASAHFHRVRSVALNMRLVAMDERLVVNTHKFGIVYAAPGQRDFVPMLANSVEDVPIQFWRFLRFLGEQIDLQGWGGFNGGLDVFNNHTGKTCFYTKWQQLDFIFHVAPLIPSLSPSDPEQIERKRHIGNDIVLMIFRDPNAPPMKLTTVMSKQTQVVIFVTPLTSESNELEFDIKIFRHKSMPEIPLFFQNTFEKRISISNTQDRNLFLATLVQAERSSYKTPSFTTLLNRVRSSLLTQVIEETFS